MNETNATDEQLPLEPDDLRWAARVCVEALAPASERDWRVRAGDLEWDAYTTMDHLIDVLGFYAVYLATRATGFLAFQTRSIVARPWPVPAASLLGALEAMAAVLADVVYAAPPALRAYHPWGVADRAGFIAMGCDEMLIHTDDVARGLGLAWQPPEALCRRILVRLFPWAPAGEDPWSALRWANGRMALADRARLGPDWGWQCAPLEEWDGTIQKARGQKPPPDTSSD